MEERAIFPELYSAPKNWYGTHYVAKLSKELPEDTLRQKYIIYASPETVGQHFFVSDELN